MDKISRIVLVLLIVGAAPCLSLAAEDAAKADEGEAPQKRIITTGAGIAVGGACIGAGLAAIGGGYAIARVGGHCIDSMARQPEAAGAMFAPMIVTAAMIEGAMLFAIVIALLAVLGSL